MRDYLAHQARVTGIIFAADFEWVLSIGRDKLFQLHSSETGQKLGSYQTDAWYTALQYPFLQSLTSDFAQRIRYEKLNSCTDLTPNPNTLSWGIIPVR